MTECLLSMIMWNATRTGHSVYCGMNDVDGKPVLLHINCGRCGKPKLMAMRRPDNLWDVEWYDDYQRQYRLEVIHAN